MTKRLQLSVYARTEHFRLLIKACVVIAALIAAFLSTGCVTSERMFPREQSSQVLEVTWQALNTVDTMQTIQIAKYPQCFYEGNPIAADIYGTEHPSEKRVMITNVVLALAHSAVSRWLDDRVDAASPEHFEDWRATRRFWHTMSIIGTTAAVANNFNNHVRPTSARCDYPPGE